MIYYLSMDDNKPSGGRRVAYRHVDILNKAGIPARILHKHSGFRLTWFEHNTQIAYIDTEIIDNENDILVLPETRGITIAGCTMPYVIFNQNAYYTFAGYKDTDTANPYQIENCKGVMCVSEDNRNYLSYAFPGLTPHRVRVSIDPIFQYSDKKQNTVAVMSRKGYSDTRQVLEILKRRNDIEPFEWIWIDNVSMGEVADIFTKAKVFLATGYQEGCPAPPLEAMISGCSVVGYTGQGARDYQYYFMQTVEPGDVIGLTKALLYAMKTYDPETARKNSEQLRQIYSADAERESVLSFWEGLL